MPIHHVLFFALAILLLSGCGGSDTSDASLEITAQDVAWATNWQIDKIDLTDAGEFYGVGLVVLDDHGTVVKATGGTVAMNEISSGNESIIATIALQKNGKSVQARCRVQGSTLETSFDDMFKSSTWYRNGDPNKVGDLYVLCGDANTVSLGQGNTDFEPGSRHIALKIYRTEEAFEERPQ